MKKITFARTNDGNRINIRFPYDADLVMAVKKIPGKKFEAADPKDKYWSVPARPESLEPLQALAKLAEVELPQALVAFIESKTLEKAANWAMSSAISAGTIEEIPAELNKTLRPFQRAGVIYMMKNRRALLGDDMGLGKTLQAIAATEAIGGLPCLVICPASLKYNWQREIEKWAPARQGHAVVVNGKEPAEGAGAHYMIVNYDILKKHLSWLEKIPWKTLIVDESHYIKNYKAQRTNFVLDLAKNIPNVYLLSGTPVLNRPIEIVPQLSALGRLQEFGGFWPFAHHYCGAYKGDYGWVMDGAENLDELNKKLREICYIRRDKRTVLTELPDKTRQLLPVEIDNRPEYVDARNELIKYIQEQGRLEAKKMAEIEDMLNVAQWKTEEEKAPERQKLIAHYRMEKAQRAARAEVLVGIETCKQISARGKLKAGRDWLIDFWSNNPAGKLVIFATHKEEIDYLQHMLVEMGQSPLILTGDTPAENRQRYVDLFQTDPAFRVFVSNIQAGGVGITLTAASHVLFVEFAWNAATMDQAEDRLWRIGQKNAVNVYWMAGIDTIDEYLIRKIEDKREIVAQLTEGGVPEIEGSMMEDVDKYLTQEAE